MGKESFLIKEIQLTLSRAMRLFRNNTGVAWAGKVVKRSRKTLTIENPRPLHAGLVQGSSDLIGWTTVDVTPEMVGRQIAVFTAAEVKTGASKPTEKQIKFLQAVRASGGIAGVVRSVEDVNLIFWEWENSTR